MNLSKKLFFFFLYICSCVPIFSQEYLPLNQDYLNRFNTIIYSKTKNLHTSIKPFLANEVSPSIINDTSIQNPYKNTERKVFNKSLIEAGNKTFALKANPIFSEVMTLSTSNDFLYNHLEAGANVLLKIKRKHGFYYQVSILQTSFQPDFVTYINTRKIIPYFGSYKRVDKGVFLYLNQTWYWSFDAGKYFNFTGGSGKHFWGEGYRSLFLSDN
jgi:hypothetical protein